MQNNVMDMTVENFTQIMRDDSKTKLIMIEFWAPGNEAADELSTQLQIIANEYANELQFVRLDCQAEQQIAQQFGIRSLPTVMLVKDGQPVDGFTGGGGDAEIRELLNKHLPKPEEGLLAQAQQALAESDFEQAALLAKQAFDLNNERADTKFVLATAYIQQGHIAQAKALMETVGLVDQDSQYQSIMGQIELAEQAADTPEIQALQQQLEASPEDMEIKVKLAVQLQQAKRVEEALALLFEVLVKDLSFGDARKFAMDTINALPAGDPLASQYRRKIYSLLY
ncbi:tetratricopeptide repeat protein [Alteromonadaceae bacterium BrNp21-10]|nr:tetratricopeptide repeat protein [Alteromonadaceae bacterium BrNp21-10]